LNSIMVASVLIFISADCPVSNRYAPELQRLHTEFAPKGIRFTLVYPNPSDDIGVIERHTKDYGLPSIVQRDPAHVLVKKAQATVTPEAVIFDSKQRIIYRGRIDDRFVELGRERPAATKQDLRNALNAVLAGRRVNPARTQAVGCFIADMK
jgi:AhpC/TSA family